MNKLNDDYFTTRRNHRENFKKKKLTFKKGILNLSITFALIIVVNFLLEQCHNKIENNKVQINEMQN